MLHHHEIDALPCRVRGLTLCLVMLAACSEPSRSDAEQVLAQVLHEAIINRSSPHAHVDKVHCLGFLDTAWVPPPILTWQDRAREFDLLCASIAAGRVKDPAPWVMSYLKRESFFVEPDVRPLSQCVDRPPLVGAERKVAYQIIVERIESLGPDEVAITFQARSLCPKDRMTRTWGWAAQCFVRRREGKWVLPEDCVIHTII